MKKPIITLFITVLLGLIILIGIYFFSLNDIKNDIKTEFGLIKGTEKEWSQAFKNYEIFQCKFGILNSEYVFVSHRDYSFRNEDREQWKTTFYNATRPHPLSSDWQISYIGGTDVKNTTFPELVEMVKEDCEQFQRGYYDESELGDLTGMDDFEKTERWNETEFKNIHWTYTPAQTKEEIAKDIRDFSYRTLKLFPEFKDVYGDIDEMTDDEVIALKERIDEEGLDESVQIADKANDIREELYSLSQKQLDQIIKSYGDWKDFTNEELLEWTDKVKADMDSGKFVLSEE